MQFSDSVAMPLAHVESSENKENDKKQIAFSSPTTNLVVVSIVNRKRISTSKKNEMQIHC